jgi:hypothetical protein
MSHIPIFSYKSYLDDLLRIKDQGHVDVDIQVARPNSAGSRGLSGAKSFMKDPVHMMGESESSKKTCPPATQDITLNLENRQKAIDEYGYGPLNPDLPNDKFWQRKVKEWNLDSIEEAQKSLCGNCAAFDQREHTLNCIAQGIDRDDPSDAEGVIEAGDLGYCKFLKFKCASRRTCDAWVTGGPLTDTNEITALEAAKKGLYYYVNKRKKAGISRSKNNPKAPTAQAWKDAAKTAKKETVELDEKWSQKYKSSINCSHPKGFSQKAHCAGKKKHNESFEMESICPDCGMCETHGNLNEIKKGQKDSNGYTKCWPGHHAQGTKKSRVTGKQVRNCVPNEDIGEATNPAQQAAIAIAMKKDNKKPKSEAEKKKITKNEAINAILENISYSKTSGKLILPEAIQGNLRTWFESRWNNIIKS